MPVCVDRKMGGRKRERVLCEMNMAFIVLSNLLSLWCGFMEV